MAKPMSRSKGKKRSLSVDFEGVEAGGKSVPDGTYDAKVVEVVEKESESSGNPYLSWKWSIISKRAKGAIVYDNASLTPQSLWRLRGLLEALGVDVPDGSMDLDLDDLVDLEATLEISNEKYDGKDRPRITGFSAIGEKVSEDDDKDDDKDDEKEEDDEPKAKSTKKVEKKSSGKKLKVGSKVTFENEDGDEVKGTITSLEDDTATVEDSEGDEWEVEVSDLTS